MVESIIALIGDFLLPYLVLSLLTMLLVELIAAAFLLREKTLHRFVCDMLCDAPGAGIAQRFYAHHLIASLNLGASKPAYIPPRLFSIVLVELLNAPDDKSARPSQTLRDTVDTVLRHTARGMELLAIERWFDAVMDAASGAYRRKALFLVMFVAAAIVLAINFDSIRVSNHVASRSLIEKRLEADIKARAAMKNDTGQALDDSFSKYKEIEFPIGWAGDVFYKDLNAMFMKAAGLITSILAITLAAPFLFDLLNKLMVVRSTIKPRSGHSELEARPVAITRTATTDALDTDATEP